MSRGLHLHLSSHKNPAVFAPSFPKSLIPAGFEPLAFGDSWMHILKRPLKKSGFLPKPWRYGHQPLRMRGKSPSISVLSMTQICPCKVTPFLRRHLKAAAVTCLAQDIPIFGVWLCLKRQLFIPRWLCSVLCLFFQPARPSPGLSPPLLQLKLQNKAIKKWDLSAAPTRKHKGNRKGWMGWRWQQWDNPILIFIPRFYPLAQCFICN